TKGRNMTDSIDHLLQQYEIGKLTRRELLVAFTLLSTLCQPGSRAQDSLFMARSFNHLNIRVTDINRSEAFYRRVLGPIPFRFSSLIRAKQFRTGQARGWRPER